MPASAANRVDQWQALDSEARFEEMDRELALAESIGFNAVRLILAEEGFGVWAHDHDGFTAEDYAEIRDTDFGPRLGVKPAA